MDESYKIKEIHVFCKNKWKIRNFSKKYEKWLKITKNSKKWLKIAKKVIFLQKNHKFWQKNEIF
jgi:hypothetical protein